MKKIANQKITERDIRRMLRILLVLTIVMLMAGCGKDDEEEALPANPGFIYLDNQQSTMKDAPIDYDSMTQDERIEAVWGDLIRANGGELKYETLTKEDQALVHYPPFDENKVYWTPKGKNYHAVKWCYTLSESKTILDGNLKEAVSAGKESPCSKCVGD